MPRRHRSSSSDSSKSSGSDSRSSGSTRRRSPSPVQRRRGTPEPEVEAGVVHRLENEDDAATRSGAAREDRGKDDRADRRGGERGRGEDRYSSRRRDSDRRDSARDEGRRDDGRSTGTDRHEQTNGRRSDNAGGGPRGRGNSRYDGPARESAPGAASSRKDKAEGESEGRGEAAGEKRASAPAKKEAAPGKAGGVYIPPFKLAQMMKECEDKVSPEYQRMTWDALRKSINGLVNKVNASNIKHILPEMFSENLIRGRGLFCRSVMKSQMASPAFSPVYAALIAVINTKFPELGELLLGRVILQFRRAYKRNDKSVCLAATKMIAHLVNQQVAHELIALEMLMLLLETPSDDGVEVAVGFVKEVGACLSELSPQGLHSVFERFRGILHEGEIDKRVQFMIEGVFAIRKAGFEASGHPSIPDNLDLVESEDQITHELSIDSEVNASTSLDVFKVDPDYQQREEEYEAVKKEILGDGDSDDDSDDEDDDSDDDDSDEEDDAAAKVGAAAAPTQQRITDATQTNLVNLRRTIYLTIMSSMDFEEAGHKLLKIQLAPGQEQELITMIIECCSQERTYMRYYGLLAQRFCYINRTYQEIFEDAFQRQYALIHRLETGKLRNTAKLFAHLLGTDALSWMVMSNIRLTEDDTTSSSRIFVKILFQELSENLGLVKLNERLNDPSCQEWFAGIFPKDAARNLRFSINFFTSIGLGGLTDASRDYLKNIPKMIAQQKPESDSDSSDSDSDSDSDSGSSSDSDSSGSGSSSSGSDSGSSSGSDSDADSPPRKPARKRRSRSRSRSPQRKRHR